MSPGALVWTTVAAGAVALRLRRVSRLEAALPGDPDGVVAEDGVRLHVEESGGRHEPLTVVLVHGFAADTSMYDPLWRALAGSARLVRFDLRGHGHSGWSGCRAATVRQLGRDLGRVLDERGGHGPIVLAGHSLGGLAVLALVRQRPELVGTRVAAVALMSTTARPLGETGVLPGLVQPVMKAGLGPVLAGLLWLAAPALQVVRPFQRSVGRRWLQHRLFAADPPAAASSTMAASWARAPLDVMSAFLPDLAVHSGEPDIGALRAVPVLVLAGTDDATFPADDARRLADRIGPTAHLVLVPGAGHLVPLTHASDVASALRRLMRRVPAPIDGRRRE